MVGRVSILYIKAMSNCKIICLLQDLETSCIKRNHLEQFTKPRQTHCIKTINLQGLHFTNVSSTV